ncbi:hypothetical protein RUM44_003169 [Polyplax serrata]|uniref:Uncharacterized protein n=1 Tax=Polyplax serrata TaxID=468196 RepID=A0ABR1AYE2_POLSC
MSGPCNTSGPKRLWRNGMEFEPKKTYPPDYSNVPSVRDWQMSPFAQERFDLDEIQRAEKKGFKARFQLEELKKKYGYQQGSPCSSPSPPPCETCRKREEKSRVSSRGNCSKDLLYQPYGPMVVSSVSYNRPELNKPRMYSYMGPSFYSGFRFETPAPKMVSPVPCSQGGQAGKLLANTYVPYGPYGEVRVTPDLYIPMGPSILPVDLNF